MNGVGGLCTEPNSNQRQCLVSPPLVLGGFGLENDAPPRTPTRIITSFGFLFLPDAIAIFYQIFSLFCVSSIFFAPYRSSSLTISMALRMERLSVFFSKCG